MADAMPTVCQMLTSKLMTWGMVHAYQHKQTWNSATNISQQEIHPAILHNRTQVHNIDAYHPSGARWCNNGVIWYEVNRVTGIRMSIITWQVLRDNWCMTLQTRQKRHDDINQILSKILHSIVINASRNKHNSKSRVGFRTMQNGNLLRGVWSDTRGSICVSYMTGH